ncbi:MAG: phage tail tube protein [Anaerovoracaceae bacterium]|nr:phage tail tube protein [Bacillota bacterium]
MGFLSNKKINPNQLINGTYGFVYVNGHKLANVESMEAKIGLEYEEVDLAEDTGKHQKYMGWSGTGTMVLKKIDSFVLAMMADAIKKGELPDIQVVTGVKDPASVGAERVQLDEVTFDEVTLMQFEQKTLAKEEIPLKFGDYTLLDLIA